MCALLVSVITLSGAANRSFRTEMEQWNPIGITQASNGMTRTQSGPQTTNRLTAGSAILPTVATAAPSGVLRGGSDNVITFTTSRKIGEKIRLEMTYTGDTPTLSGMTGTPKSGEYLTYKLTSQTVTIRGDVTLLYCSSDQLTTLDVSKNTALTDLGCEYNQLTALDVSKNTALTKLSCSGNQLTALDVSQNTALTDFLICFDNQLKALDVSQNTALKSLDCSGNQLTALDVSRNTALTRLNCERNQLKALDVSRNTALTRLSCFKNQLTALDVSKNTALEWLYCSNNQLTALDVSKNTKLGTLRCYGNQIKGEEMTRLVNSLPDHRTGWTFAGEFVVVQSDAEGNRCFKKDVAIAKGKNWKTLMYNSDTKEDVDYEGEVPSPYIMSFTTAKLIGEKISLYMKYSGAAPLLIGANGIPESEKYVTYTLTSQTVTIRGNVTELYCNGNQLTTLDVSQNTELTTLFCSNNQLKALDVSQNTALTVLTCFNNQIKGEEMTRLVNSLLNRTGKSVGTFTVVQEPYLEGNICLKSDVAIAESKNWDTQKYKSNTKEYVAYEGAEKAQPLKVTLTKEGEGTITATGATDLNAVPLGTELTIVATPADGYELKELTANGTDILATKKFTVTADTEVKATFTKKTAAEVVEAGTLRLYPNPASTYVNVKGAKANTLVRLYGANGALRYEARTDADGTLQIDLSAYAEGTYLLLVDSNAQRLLIQR